MNTCRVSRAPTRSTVTPFGGQQDQQHSGGGPGEPGVGLDPGVGARCAGPGPDGFGKSVPACRCPIVSLPRHRSSTLGADPAGSSSPRRRFAVPLPGLTMA